MDKEIKNVVKKTAKIAGVTCVALGGAALIASGAALRAVTEGAKYLKDTIEKIVKEEPEAGEPVAEATTEETEVIPVEEADFAEPESQKVIVIEDHA